MKIQGTLRQYPGGAPATGKSVAIKVEADDSTLATDTTDAAGRWSYTQNGSPGPVRWEATDTEPDPDVTRAGSSRSYGSGGPYSLYELVYALRALGNGVIPGYGDEMAVSSDGAGLDLDVAAGGAVVAGIPAIFYEATKLTSLGTRDAANPKACYVVLEVSPPGQADEGRAELKTVCGAAAASPSLPALTQSETLYQMPLATYQLPSTASTTITSVADARPWLRERNPVVSSVVRRTDPASTTTTTSTGGTDVSGLTTTLVLRAGVTYDLEARAVLTAKAGSGQTVSIAPYLNGVGNLASWIASDSPDYVAIANAHTLAGVVGTGAAVSCGLRIKVSGGTASYITGYLHVTAYPRS